MGSIPGSGRSFEEGNGNQLQYSCLGNFMDQGTWWATDHGVTKELIMIQRLNSNNPTWMLNFVWFRQIHEFSVFVHLHVRSLLLKKICPLYTSQLRQPLVQDSVVSKGVSKLCTSKLSLPLLSQHLLHYTAIFCLDVGPSNQECFKFLKLWRILSLNPPAPGTNTTQSITIC